MTDDGEQVVSADGAIVRGAVALAAEGDQVPGNVEAATAPHAATEQVVRIAAVGCCFAAPAAAGGHADLVKEELVDYLHDCLLWSISSATALSRSAKQRITSGSAGHMETLSLPMPSMRTGKVPPPGYGLSSNHTEISAGIDGPQLRMAMRLISAIASFLGDNYRFSANMPSGCL